MKIYIWQHSWVGNILDGTPVYEWSEKEEDIPYVTSFMINTTPEPNDLMSLRFVQEHIVWDIHKSLYDEYDFNGEFDIAVTDYAQAQGFYKHD